MRSIVGSVINGDPSVGGQLGPWVKRTRVLCIRTAALLDSYSSHPFLSYEMFHIVSAVWLSRTSFEVSTPPSLLETVCLGLPTSSSYKTRAEVCSKSSNSFSSRQYGTKPGSA